MRITGLHVYTVHIKKKNEAPELWSKHLIAKKKKKLGKVKTVTVTDFLFLGSKITANSNCSHKIKRPFSLDEKL